MLIAPGLHADEATAAMSIATNRASKVAKLLDAGRLDLAEGNAQSLLYDIAEHIYLGYCNADPRLTQNLCGIATRTLDQVSNARTETG